MMQNILYSKIQENTKKCNTVQCFSMKTFKIPHVYVHVTVLHRNKFLCNKTN